VHDTSAESRHRVLPRRPGGTAGLDEAAQPALVTREGLIGTAAV
jgi:nitrile hydratase